VFSILELTSTVTKTVVLAVYQLKWSQHSNM